MLPASDDTPGGNDAGGSTGGGWNQEPPVFAVNFDVLLTNKLTDYREQLCRELEHWLEKKPNQNALEALVKLSAELFNIIYSQYRGEKEKDAKKALVLEELSAKLRLATFHLRNMWQATGKLSPEEELKLHDSLLDLDVTIELVLRDKGDQQAPEQV